MLKIEYNRMNEKISPDAALQERIMQKAAPRLAKRFRPAIAIAAVLIAVLMAFPAMAAYVPAINELMFHVSPEMAARFTPVQESCIVDGIRMEVVSASIHGATAEVCISFEDLEGERVTAQMRTDSDSFYGLSPFLSGSMGSGDAHCSFDGETGKLIYVTERSYSFYSGRKGRYLTVDELFDGKMTVCVDKLYRYVKCPIAEIPVEMTDNEVMTVQVERGTPTDHAVQVPFDGFGYASVTRGDPWLFQESYDLLEPREAVHGVTDELAVTGMAYINGRLHIQTRLRPDDAENPPTYGIWFADCEGNTRKWSNKNTFVIEQGSDWGCYEETIYDISQEELQGLRLLCQVEERETIEGPWRVTFPITESDYGGDHDDGVPMTEVIDG